VGALYIKTQSVKVEVVPEPVQV